MGRNRAPRRASLLLLPLLLLAGPAPAEGPDAAVLRRIEEVRRIAARIEIDGKGEDWEGIPSVADADAAPAPAPPLPLDVRRVAVAPLEEDLLVLVETAASPSREPAAFHLEIDFLGRSGRDLLLVCGAPGPVRLVAYPEGGKPLLQTTNRIRVACGRVLEARLPLSLAIAAFGADTILDWKAGLRRSHVRVKASTRHPPAAGAAADAPADDGPAAASFRLTIPPPELDPPLPAGGTPIRTVGVPVQGRWFVRQGPQGLWSHRDLWAYDLSVVDHALRPTASEGSLRPGDYYSWAKPVIAPEAGKVVFDTPPVEDRDALEKGAGKDSGNTLGIRFEDGYRLLFGHLQKGSLALPRGSSFAAGATLARVGNSGDSGAPHLHLSLHDRPGEFVGLPLGFRSVRVGLNPGGGDPWDRDLEAWAVREGWFVEGLPAPLPPASPPR